MKKVLLLLIFALALTLCACNAPLPNEENDYPEGSIALTQENFYDYFEVKVKTDLSENYITDELGVHKLTEAVSYVAIVPKDDYRTVSGVITFQLNSAIARSPAASYPEMHISASDLRLTLDDDIVNKSYRLSAKRDTDYYVMKGSDTVTLLDVTGYLIEGADEKPSELDALTDTDRKNSSLVLDELSARIDAYALAFPTLES